MPIYEYECQTCGHKLEVMQRMTEDPLKTCPSCAADALRKLISAVGFQLKGTGWYETDFKHKGKPKSGNGGEKDAPAKGDGGESKTESPSESKTESPSESNKTGSGKSSGAATSTSSD